MYCYINQMLHLNEKLEAIESMLSTFSQNQTDQKFRF